MNDDLIVMVVKYLREMTERGDHHAEKLLEMVEDEYDAI